MSSNQDEENIDLNEAREEALSESEAPGQVLDPLAEPVGSRGTQRTVGSEYEEEDARTRPPEDGLNADRVFSRLDPNTADEAHLAAIARLGDRRARAIVVYREQFVRAHPGYRAFDSMNDLVLVNGISPETAEALGEDLYIPVGAATRETRNTGSPPP